MPTVSIYVSNEDYDKFRAIKKKSEFIHRALNPSFQVLNKMISDSPKRPGRLEIAPADEKPQKKPKTDLCKQHGIDKNLCREMKHA